MIQKSKPKSFRQQLATGKINLESDTLKLALMNDSFIFDVNTHAFWEDVSTYEIVHQNGYLQPYSLTNPSISNFSVYSANYGHVLITASGGDIVFSSAIIYDDTATNKPIIACLLLSQEKIVSASYSIKNIIITIGD